MYVRAVFCVLCSSDDRHKKRRKNVLKDTQQTWMLCENFARIKEAGHRPDMQEKK